MEILLPGEVVLALRNIQRKKRHVLIYQSLDRQLTTDSHTGLIFSWVIVASTIFTEHVVSYCNISGLYLEGTQFEAQLKCKSLLAHIKTEPEITP
jgi:hypothetical protein